MSRFYKAFLFFLTVIVFACGGLAAKAHAFYEDREPIVFVPGIMGSWNWDVLRATNNPKPTVTLEGWSFPPSVHTYDTLIESFKDGVGDDKVFIAFYDWRMGARDAVKNYLKPVIDQAKAVSPTGKVNIVAHSMGGNVARAYIEDPDIYENDVDQLITIGTPNYGSSEAYLVWEGVNFSMYEKWKQITLSFYLFILESNARDFNSREVIANAIPSVKELLPTYDYIRPNVGTALTPIQEMAEQNPLLPDLNSDANLRRLLFNVKVTNIAGTNVATNKIVVTEPPSASDLKAGLWLDGKPTPLPPFNDTVKGDGTVLVESALLPTPPAEDFGPPPPLINLAPWRRLFAWFMPTVRAQFTPPFGQGPPVPEPTHITISGACHTCLPNMAILDTLTTLGLTIQGDIPLPVPDPDSLLGFYFASPVSVQVTDPQGRSVTSTTNNIPDAVYWDNGLPDGPRLVFIPNPLGGQYRITLTGTGTGHYHVGTQYFGGAGAGPLERLEGDITKGETIVLESDVGNEGLTAPPSVVSTSVSYAIPLSKGFNLVALPVVPESTAPADVLGKNLDDPAVVSAVYAYDALAENPGEVWQVYHPGHPETSSLASMTAGYGYWVNYRADTPAELTGRGELIAPDAAEAPGRTLGAGWNLIGLYKTNIRPDSRLEDALGALTPYVRDVLTFDNTGKQFAVRAPADPARFTRGYWVFLKNPEPTAGTDTTAADDKDTSSPNTGRPPVTYPYAPPPLTTG